MNSGQNLKACGKVRVSIRTFYSLLLEFFEQKARFLLFEGIVAYITVYVLCTLQGEGIYMVSKREEETIIE